MKKNVIIIVTGVLYLLSYLDSRYLILKKLVSKYTFFGGNLCHHLPTYYRHLRYVFRIQALHATIFLKIEYNICEITASGCT